MNIVVYAIVISMFIATDMKKALIISVIMSALGWLLILMLTLAVVGLNNATG